MITILANSVGTSNLKKYWIRLLIFAVLYPFTVFITFLIGSDLGAFIFIGIHFVIAPLFGIWILITGILAIVRIKQLSMRIAIFMSLAVPIAIIYLASSGAMLGLSFQR
jgi:hypothetical protein